MSRLRFFFTLALLYSAALQAQHETLDDPYLPPPAARMTSPAYRFSGNNFITTQVNVDANGNNILGDAANEPSLAVNPLHPEKMAIGWRQFDNVASNFRQAGFAYTLDGGATWINPGVIIQPGVFRSDPVLAADAEGRIYYNSLTVDSNFHCDVFRSIGDGAFDDGVYAYGGDKQWMAIDRTEGPGKGNIYTYWSANFTSCTGNFTRSLNEGDSYEDCLDMNQAMWVGTMDVGPDGTLYVSGAGQLSISSDVQQPGATTWETGFVNVGGDVGFGGPNPSGLTGQTSIAVNPATGPLYEQVYVLQSGHAPDALDPLDVFFVRSTDGGATWSDPVRVNDDTDDTAWQWFGTMSVAPTGRIDVVWLDTKDNPGTFLSSLYYTKSYDGGLTWAPSERLSDAFDPHVGWPDQEKMGDYFHMISDSAGARLAWAGTLNGEQDVYYTYIYAETVGTSDADVTVQPSAPNPFSDYTTLSFATRRSDPVTVAVYDQSGTVVRLLDAGPQAAGQHIVRWDGKNTQGASLPAGVYVAKITTGNTAPAVIKLIKQ